jgi:hypothetical protein
MGLCCNLLKRAFPQEHADVETEDFFQIATGFGSQFLKAGTAIWAVLVFFHDAGAHDTLEEEIETAIRQTFFFEYATDSDHGMNHCVRGVVILLIPRTEQCDAHQAIGVQGVPSHRPVAILEYMQGQYSTRKQDSIGERKNRDPSRKVDVTLCTWFASSHGGILVDCIPHCPSPNVLNSLPTIAIDQSRLEYESGRIRNPSIAPLNLQGC